MSTDTRKPILLLVEDSEDDAYFFKHTLERSGVRCSLKHVTNGAEAIEYLRSGSSSEPPTLPDVIFLDLKMPVLNGFEVLEWMRTQTFCSSIHVIVLSGSDYTEDKERAARLGARDYLVKPVRVHNVHRILGEVCPREVGARV
jgi:CheY-like chemotaxis protein